MRLGALGLGSFDCSFGEQFQEKSLKSEGSRYRIGKHRGKSIKDTHFSSHKNGT